MKKDFKIKSLSNLFEPQDVVTKWFVEKNKIKYKESSAHTNFKTRNLDIVRFVETTSSPVVAKT